MRPSILLCLHRNVNFSKITCCHPLLSLHESDCDEEASHCSHPRALKPVVCMHGLAARVLGETLQFHSNDILVDEQEYIFIPIILEKLGMASAIFPINKAIQNPLYDVMEGIHQVAGENHIIMCSLLSCYVSIGVFLLQFTCH